MKKICTIMLLFFIVPNTALSDDCGSSICNESDQEDLNNPENVGAPSILDKLDEQIIASVNNQISKIDNDLSLEYRKKKLSLKYNMNDKIPLVDSHFSITYKKRAVTLNYSIAIW